MRAVDPLVADAPRERGELGLRLHRVERPEELLRVDAVAAYELARRGAAVTVYERGEPGAGQSGGESRIFRHAHDDPRLVALAVESRERWRAWEARFGVELVAPVGVRGARARGRAAARAAARGRRARPDGRRGGARCRSSRPRGRRCSSEDGGVIRTTAAVRALVAPLGGALVKDEVVETGAVGRGAGRGRGRPLRPRDRVRRGATPPRSPPPPAWRSRCGSRPTRATPIRSASPAPLACLLDGASTAPTATRCPATTRYAVGLERRRPRPRYVAERLPGLEPRRRRDADVLGHRAAVGRTTRIAVWEAGALRFVAGNNLFKHAPALGHRARRRRARELRPRGCQLRGRGAGGSAMNCADCSGLTTSTALSCTAVARAPAGRAAGPIPRPQPGVAALPHRAPPPATRRRSRSSRRRTRAASRPILELVPEQRRRHRRARLGAHRVRRATAVCA